MIEVRKYWSWSRAYLISVFYEDGEIRTCYWDSHKKISKKFAKSLLNIDKNKNISIVTLGNFRNVIFKYKI